MTLDDGAAPKRGRRKILFALGWILAVLVCGAAILPELPVNYLTISGEQGVVLASPLSGGRPFITAYIHSVQLTPVIDEYRIVQGKIWGWEERVKSHNAGLPFSAPEHGRFIMAPPWMIVQGGRRAEERIAYRVGNAELGRNTWLLPPFGELPAYTLFASNRVYIEASVKKFSDAPLMGWPRAADIPPR
jgi:hypothetical protein